MVGFLGVSKLVIVVVRALLAIVLVDLLEIVIVEGRNRDEE